MSPRTLRSSSTPLLIQRRLLAVPCGLKSVQEAKGPSCLCTLNKGATVSRAGRRALCAPHLRERGELARRATRPPTKATTSIMDGEQGYIASKQTGTRTAEGSPRRPLLQTTYPLSTLRILQGYAERSGKTRVYTYMYMIPCLGGHGRGHRLALQNRAAARHTQLTVNSTNAECCIRFTANAMF